MYCPGCGAESLVGSKYCKRCGGALTTTALDVRPSAPVSSRPVGAAWAMALASTAIGLGGLGITIEAVVDLVRSSQNAPVGGITAIAIVMLICGSLTIVSIVGLLIRLLSRLLGLASEPSMAQKIAHKALNDNNPAVVTYPPTASPQAAIPASVTEHTTRNFEARIYDRSARD
jgi:hypothetical protein